MTSNEVERALRRTITEAANVADNPLAHGEVRQLAKAVALLALIVGEQEKRIAAYLGSLG